MPKHIRRHTAVYLYFLILVIAMTYPLVRVFSTRLAGDAFSDAYEYVHHIWWMKHALLNGEPLFWQPLLAYPDGLNGAWLWGNPLQSFPAWLFALVMPLPAAYNAALLLALSLNGWAMYYLCWRLLRSRPAAVLGGTVFALYPAIQGHLIASHIGLVTLWGVPLYIAALLQLETSPRRRDVLWAAFLFVVSILGNNLLLIYVLFPVTVWLVGARLLRREWAWLRRMLYAVVLGGVLALVFVLPVALEQVNSPVQLDDSQVRYSADVLAVAAPSFYNPLFSDLEYSRNVLGEVKNVEGTGYIGLVAGVLSLVALVRVPAARGWGGMALLTWVLSLGPLLKVNDEVVTVTIDIFPTYVPLPWLGAQYVPVLNLARTPARFNLALGVMVAVMAAYGLAHLLRYMRWRAARWSVVVALVPLIFFESAVWWEGNRPHLQTVPDLRVEAITALREDNRVRAVLNLPYDHPVAAKQGMYLQTRHQTPLIAGHVTRRTPVNPARLATLQTTLDPVLLDAAGADAVILHREWASDALETHALDRLGPPEYTDDRFMLWRLGAQSNDE